MDLEARSSSHVDRSPGVLPDDFQAD